MGSENGFISPAEHTVDFLALRLLLSGLRIKHGAHPDAGMTGIGIFCVSVPLRTRFGSGCSSFYLSPSSALGSWRFWGVYLILAVGFEAVSLPWLMGQGLEALCCVPGVLCDLGHGI